MPPTARKQPADRRPAKKTATRSRARVTQEPPVAVDPENKYAPTAWGSGLGGLEDLQVPSGQLCQVRRPGVQGLMEAGVLHDVDSLTALVDQKHVKRVNGQEQIDAASLMKSPDNLKNLFHVVDRVICYCVVQPQIVMTPNDPTSRKAGVVYADMIDIMDKTFIFQFAVGGTRGLESFREQLAEAMGGVDALEAAEGSPV